jgi:hypothetical protein
VLQSCLATSNDSLAVKKGTHALAIMVRTHDASRWGAVRATTTPLLRGLFDDSLVWLYLCVTCKGEGFDIVYLACHAHKRMQHATPQHPYAPSTPTDRMFSFLGGNQAGSWTFAAFPSPRSQERWLGCCPGWNVARTRLALDRNQPRTQHGMLTRKQLEAPLQRKHTQGYKVGH